jgi:uncharacterized protein YggU (UPF0235/DUF167 family)
MLFLETKRGLEFSVRLTPKASRNKIGDVSVDAEGQFYLKVYVTAVPENNKANEALIQLLSKFFKIPKTSLKILSGATDRLKRLCFEGSFDKDDLEKKLSLLN